jgi:hypothetical protein
LHESTICFAGELKRGLNTFGIPAQMALDVGFELIERGPSKKVRMFHLQDLQHIQKQFFRKKCFPRDFGCVPLL